MMLNLLIFTLFFLHTANSFHVTPLSYSILSENTETVVDLSRKAEKRFYLHITNEQSSFFMFVTPCGAPIHWQLFSLEQEIGMAEELDIVSNVASSLEQSEKLRLLAGEEDSKRMTYYSHRLPRKVLLVVRAPSASSASVRIFFTPSLFRLEDQYPPLPHDTRLATTLLENENKAKITWKIAPQIRNSPESGRYRICTIVSRRDPPMFAGLCDHVEEGVEAVKCVPQGNNSVVIDDLRKDRTYFVTVFIRDHKRGTSSSYETTSIQTPPGTSRKVARNVIPRKQKKSAPRQQLADGQLSQVHLEPRKGSFLNLKFYLPNGIEEKNGTQSAMFIVHACDGLIRINVFRNGKILKQSDSFSGFRRFVVTNIRNGHLRFQIVNDDEKEKAVRVWASTDMTSSPYADLPDDTSVKIVGRSCDSTTIQFTRAHDEHVRYCVYQRRETSHFLEHLVSLADNLCEGGLSSSTLVGCYTHSSHEEPQFIETIVDGLQPSSTYRLDLLATPLDRPSAISLPYRTVWVRTSRFCQNY